LKVGGSLREAAVAALAAAIAAAEDAGKPAVVVHGGGPRITQALRAAGIELPFVAGRRRTTAAAMPIVERVLVEEVGAEIAGSLERQGLRPLRLSGSEGLLRAAPIPGMERTAEVASVDPAPLFTALRARRVPVVAPIGFDEGGLTYNINADVAAGAVAAALGADRIVFLTDVDGIYRGWPDGERIVEITPTDLDALIRDGILSAGMIPKAEAALAALRQGVAAAYMVNGRHPDAALWAVTAANDSAVEYGTRIQAAGARAHWAADAPNAEVAR
jgi:acetylglutamate kinase